MTEPANSAIAASVAELIIRYSFDLNGYSLDRWIEQWLAQYPPAWLYSAVIEALYQGRYKAISVWQILDFWRRRGKPVQHFNRDFERIISGRSIPLLFSESTSPLMLLPDPLLVATEAAIEPSAQPQSYSTFQRNHGLSAADYQLTSSVNTDLDSLWISERQDDLQSEASPFEHPPAIQPFKPAAEFQLHLPPPQKTRAVAPLPIQQFVPTSGPPEIPHKLKAIARSILRSNAEATARAIQSAKQQPQSNPAEICEGTEAEIARQPETNLTPQPLDANQANADQADS